MNDKDQDTSATAELAMQQVLQAERDAERVIQDCEEKARETVREAQSRAQRIHSRTDQRITNMEMRHSHKLDHMIKVIEREGAVELRNDAGQTYDPGRLEEVIRRMAADLCQTRSREGDDPEADQ